MKRFSRIAIVLLCGFLAGSLAFADEGMWLYNDFPKDRVKAQHGFKVSQSWLDHVRLSSVRFNNGGSGSFVSADGLTFTNHHVGAVCIQQLSTNGKDYVKTGFYAPTRAEEAKCPDLELDQLVGIEDVTSKVNAGVTPGMPAPEAGKAQRAAMADVEKACANSTGLRCDVVTFYSGAAFNLYKYKKYTDVRLVFAPEFSMAFFGGDADNFTYPRYDLDISFFRVYENGQPARLDNYLKWSKGGVKDGDLIFVSGHPGNTGRLRTMSQLEFLRDVEYPSRLDRYARRLAALEKFSSQSPENARTAQRLIFGYANSHKALTGYEAGLKNQELMARKVDEENKLRASLAANPRQKAEIGDPWSTLAQAMQVHKELYLPFTYLEQPRGGFDSQQAILARHLVRVAAEKAKPNQDRIREYRDSALASLEQTLFSPVPIYKSLEVTTLTESLTEMQQALGNDNPAVQKVLNGRQPRDVAEQVIAGTKLDDVAVRKQLYQGGQAAIEASNDPFIVMMRAVDPDARAIRKRYEDQVESVERQEGAKIARIQFSESGYNAPPDATFTLRLSYGAIRGYTENGNKIPFFTEMGGAFQHAAEHGDKDPFRLPESWMTNKSRLKLKTPLNFVSTADIIGGNSGSPTVSKKGEVVGIIFDGNIQSLSWNFAYDDAVGRAVSVDSRGIQEALRKVYGARALADELLGKSGNTEGR